MRKLLVAFTALLVASFSFMATATAASLVTDDGFLELAKPVMDAIRVGNYAAAAALAVVFATALVAKFGSKKYPWLKSGPGKAALTMLTSGAGAMAFGLLGGVSVWTASLWWKALSVGVVAAGGYSLIKSLLGPLVPKAPAWLQPLLKLALWAFDHTDGTEKALDDARSEGEKAVDAAPPTGLSGIVGKPRELP